LLSDREEPFVETPEPMLDSGIVEVTPVHFEKMAGGGDGLTDAGRIGAGGTVRGRKDGYWMWRQGALAGGGASAGTPRPGTPSVPDEIVMARTAVGRKDNTSAPSSQVNSPLHGKLTWKRAASPNPWPRDHPIDRLSDH